MIVIGPIAKFAVSWQLFYHYFGAVRHLYWDKKPDIISTQQATESSYQLFGLATVLSIGVSALSL